ncbi:MAG: pilus assembly protein, partial [Anaerolineales bacterium]|nr:pilus assembly protein [Anaerolineales bacterium]
EKGQGLVEFALAITLLLFMLAGTIDLGRAFFTYMAMRDAAQEGASFAIINAMNGTAIEQRAKTTTTPAGGFSGALAVNLNIDEVEVLTQVTGDPCAGSPVTVTVTYDEFPLFFPFSNILFGKNSIPLSTSVTDTILLPACE